MNNEFEQLYILIQDIESAYFRIAKLRQDLLDNRRFEEWLELVYTSSALDTAIDRLTEILRQGRESL